MACAPSEDSDQPGHSPSLIRVFAVRMKKAWVLSPIERTAKTLIRLGGCQVFSISVLRILDTEANKFYDRNHQLYDAALLTRCYTQHALRPFIDSEINHKRHFIKIPFINKVIEFIDLPSIFKDRSVTSSILAYFQNSEPPIICYKYNKPIRNTVFNFNKLVSDLDIHANTPES